MKGTFLKNMYTRAVVAGQKDKGSGRNPTRLLTPMNRRTNVRKSVITGYIGCQGGGGPADRLRFGLFRMSLNGCEIIAVYNLLKFAGKWKDIRDLTEDFEKTGALALGGFGVRPGAIRAYLSAELGTKTVLYRADRAEEYDELLGLPIPAGEDPKKKRAAILSFWNGPEKWTVHTVAVFRLPNGRIRVFNYYSNRLFTDFDSVDALLHNSRRQLIPMSLIVPEIPDGK